MLSVLQRYIQPLHLVLFALLGLSLGHLGATGLGLYLTPPLSPAETQTVAVSAPAQPATLASYDVIVERNIFNTAARGRKAATADAPQPAPTPQERTAARADLRLLGTVAAGEGGLALIEANREIEVYRQGADLPGGGRLEEIARHLVRIRNADGTLSELPLYEDDGKARPARPSSTPGTSQVTTGEGIRQVGENRFAVDRAAVEAARSNMGELLKSARMEPNLVNGRTEGFVVKMIRPRSLLANLGIRRGDIIMEVNDVSLDSPEKALQIFQQLREARNISIGLQRDGSPINMDYEVN